MAHFNQNQARRLLRAHTERAMLRVLLELTPLQLDELEAAVRERTVSAGTKFTTRTTCGH